MTTIIIERYHRVVRIVGGHDALEGLERRDWMAGYRPIAWGAGGCLSGWRCSFCLNIHSSIVSQTKFVTVQIQIETFEAFDAMICP
jgi:hypothetical protein